MSRELKNIFNLYSKIDDNKKIVSEVLVRPSESMYPNLKFASRTRQDEINKALLDDLQKASELTGLDITVDFAKTGHNKYAKSGNVSRHYSQEAVDIDYIGGKVVSPKNKDVVNRYVDALLKMGYVKNSESGNPKAVLTFGFAGHDNHIHVSNKLESPSQVDPNYQPISTDGTDGTENLSSGASGYGSLSKISPTIQSGKPTSSTPDDMVLYQAAKNLGSNIGKFLGITEGFGKNIQKTMGILNVPGSFNPKIKSPVDGMVNNRKFVSDCRNQILIDIKDSQYILQYCGVSKPKVKNGESVSVGQVIGLMEKEDVAQVYLLNSSYQRQYLDSSMFDKGSPKITRDKESYKKPDERTYADAAIASLILAPKKIFGNVYDKDTGELKVRKWSTDSSKRPVDPWIINAIKKPFQKKKKDGDDEKLDENIKRIKGLL